MNSHTQRLLSLFIILICAVPLFAADTNKKNPSAKENRGLKVASKGDGRRIALVIGNGDYRNAPRLANPANDARLMASTLKEVGFDLYGGKAFVNQTRDQMISAIEDFGDQLNNDDTALIYYAGHGMQVRGENYLVPVDADIKKEWEVDTKAVDGRRIFSKLAGRNNAINIVVLDACRNNPFASSFRTSAAGLASISAPSGTIVAFSTAPGQVAEDGTGQNSIYTRELAKQIKQPGLRIEDVFMQVRRSVEQATGNNQQPWENTALKGRFFFVGGEAATQSSQDMQRLAMEKVESDRKAKEAEQRASEAEEKVRLAEQKAAEAEEKARQQVALKKQLKGKPVISDDDVEFEKNGLKFYKDVVVDTRTGLMWARNGNISGKAMNWNDAKKWVKALEIGGYNNWRLPKRKELASFQKQRRNSLSEWFNANGFNNVQSNYYWTGSRNTRNNNLVWVVYMYDGGSYSGNMNRDYYVWPVRDAR